MGGWVVVQDCVATDQTTFYLIAGLDILTSETHGAHGIER